MFVTTAIQSSPTEITFHVKLGVSGQSKSGRKASVESPEMVRTLSPGGVYLGKVSISQAHFYIREGLAKGIGGRGKQTFRALQMLHAQVDTRVPMTPSTVYVDESHVMSMKRPAPGGGFERWHAGLSFDDLRKGRMRPAKAKTGRGGY